MRGWYVIGLIFGICSCTSGQNPKLFEISETIMKHSSGSNQYSDLKKNDPVFFEDEQYRVTKTCNGEFGGSIRFENKKSGIVYACSATCPVVVNKLNGKYIVTCTLAHMCGFSEIMEIANPDSMQVFSLPGPQAKKKRAVDRFPGEIAAQSTKGTKQLLDSSGVLTLASFPYNGKLYHIVTDFRKTYVAQVQNKKFETIDTISGESLWTYDPVVIITKDNHHVVFFSNEKVKGCLDIFEGKIEIIRDK